MNKNALITGSSRGIGLATARAFFDAGYNICLNCVNSTEKMRAEVLALNMSGQGNKAIGFCADISDYSKCLDMIKYAESELGHIDVLINNASIAHVGLFSEMQPRDYQNIISLNLISVMNLSHLVLPDMVKNHCGCIINISSIWGEYGASCEAVYSASKGGVNAFTKSLAKELGPAGIRVNAISCGVIDTDMNAWLSEYEKDDLKNQIALSRFGSPHEIARVALFLASDDASYITGSIISADGGI